ncbi:MAG: YkgJ family cysteine cluster protein [Desulfuromonadaceae bacterium]|nr:YkgJ family cysteine cluster protein [Desulfuromonadaceae bacterium]MDD5104876.1 YkgJ family cysteine cluster protein [Desulfuromonadaceae bacterium]
MSDLLENYDQLIAKVDALCNDILSALGGQITCTGGCSSCCTAITVFPVEAAALKKALNSRSSLKSSEILRYISTHADGERCPLLSQDRCLLYEARPIICRTHGLPIIYTADGKLKSDCCPLNLTGTGTISGSHTVDLDKLNTLLVAINTLYMSHMNSTSDIRMPIAEAFTTS